MKQLLMDFKFQFPLLQTIKFECKISDSDLSIILKTLNNVNVFPKLSNLILLDKSFAFSN